MILEICKTKESSELEEIGEYRGMKLELQINVARQEFELFIKGNFEYKSPVGNDIYGNITRIDNALSNVGKDLEDSKKELENTKKQLENAKIDVKVPFDKEDQICDISMLNASDALYPSSNAAKKILNSSFNFNSNLV